MKKFLVICTLVAAALARPSLLHGSHPPPNYQLYGAPSGVSSSSSPQQLTPWSYLSNGASNADGSIYDRYQANQDRDESEDVQQRIQAVLPNEHGRYSLNSKPLIYSTSTSSFSNLPYDSRVLNAVQSQYQQQGVSYGLNPLYSAARNTQPISSLIPTGAYSNSRNHYIQSQELNSIGAQQQLASLNSRQNNLYSQQSLVRPSLQSLSRPSLQSNDVQWAYGSDGQLNTEPRW